MESTSKLTSSLLKVLDDRIPVPGAGVGAEKPYKNGFGRCEFRNLAERVYIGSPTHSAVSDGPLVNLMSLEHLEMGMQHSLKTEVENVGLEKLFSKVSDDEKQPHDGVACADGATQNDTELDQRLRKEAVGKRDEKTIEKSETPSGEKDLPTDISEHEKAAATCDDQKEKSAAGIVKLGRFESFKSTMSQESILATKPVHGAKTGAVDYCKIQKVTYERGQDMVRSALVMSENRKDSKICTF